MQKHTSESIRLAIAARNREMEILLSQTPVDHLAVEELRSANQRDLRVVTAEHLITAAPHAPLRPELASFFDRFFPKAETILPTRAFRATR